MKDSQSLNKKQKAQNKTVPKRTFKKKNVPLVAVLTRESSVPVSIEKTSPHPLTVTNRSDWNNILLFLLPLFLLVIFLTLTVINNQLLQQLVGNQQLTTEVITPLNPYPLVKDLPLLDLSAKSAIVVDADSQVVIFSKNPTLRFSMASTTKIMTALTALDYFKQDQLLTVKSSWSEGSVLHLQPGEEFSFEDLLYAMLLPSANDAAMVIAQNYPGGVSAFIAKMNEKALSLHLTDTHFADPTGLDDDGDYTTVVDMSRLASYAVKDPRFTVVTNTKEKVILSHNILNQYPLYNLNKLLGTNGVTGIKTGTTEGAGEVLVTSAVADGHTFIIVVMNSERRFIDTQTLLNFITQEVAFTVPTQL